MNKKYKSGFVSIIGRTNVGKSTLMNNIVGEKIAIMSDKPQTTRNTIQAVFTDEEAQIIFMDTPGMHKPKNKLGELMVKSATEATKNVDLIIYVTDVSKSIGKGDRMIIDNLKMGKTPVVLVLNKVDLLEDKGELFDIIKMYDKENLFKEIIPVSAIKGSNVDAIVKVIKARISEGPKYFPDSMITDQPERAIIAELIREKVLHYIHDEVPHGVAVEIERIKYKEKNNLTEVSAIIYCERDSHKGIIIGKGGRKLKGIGKAARLDIEFLLGTKVNLQVWVKVKKNWRNLQSFINNFGLNQED